MRVIYTEIEQLDATTIRVTTTLDLAGEPSAAPSGLGEGPTGDAIPDQIVRYLIDRAPEPVALADIQAELGGNPSTVNRQAWTLASNAPDLQIRLRGWVTSPNRGEYQLTLAALEQLGRKKR